MNEETAAHTDACPTAKLEGSLALVEEANMALEDLSFPEDMTKLNVDYL